MIGLAINLSEGHPSLHMIIKFCFRDTSIKPSQGIWEADALVLITGNTSAPCNIAACSQALHLSQINHQLHGLQNNGL